MRRNRKPQCLFVMILPVIWFTVDISAQAQVSQPSPSASPSPTTSSTPTLESRFFKNVLSDQKAIWTAPFHMQGEDARWLVPLGLATTALIVTDRRTGDEIAESTDQLEPSRVISYAGNTFVVGGVAAGFYVFGRTQNNYRARETGLLGAEALIDSGIVVTVVKAATQRRRPMQEKHSDFFDGGSSFPSGHAITAWTMATVVASEYNDRKSV